MPSTRQNVRPGTGQLEISAGLIGSESMLSRSYRRSSEMRSSQMFLLLGPWPILLTMCCASQSETKVGAYPSKIYPFYALRRFAPRPVRGSFVGCDGATLPLACCRWRLPCSALDLDPWAVVARRDRLSNILRVTEINRLLVLFPQ